MKSFDAEDAEDAEEGKNFDKKYAKDAVGGIEDPFSQALYCEFEGPGSI